MIAIGSSMKRGSPCPGMCLVRFVSEKKLTIPALMIFL
jgi:hypothetical protein